MAGTSSAGDEQGAAAPPAAAPGAVLELKGTGSSFGRSLAEVGEEGVSAPLVVADPRDGSRELANAAACRGKVVLMWRGGCSFVDKVRRAQTAGAVAAVVVQTDLKKWPFTMSDTTGAGADILLPSLMVAPKDGDALLKALEAGESATRPPPTTATTTTTTGPAATTADPIGPPTVPPTAATVPPPNGSGSTPVETEISAGGLWAHARAVDHHSSCAVCLQELVAEEMAVKLPCTHLFHEECVRTWLKKQHTCPTCRGPLPRKDAPPEGESSANADSMREWMNALSQPRGTAPMPSSGMYT
uniref:RING-type domain-containing protein n=1 Tax=Haptolina brevifila TaxID=156173 RepID=A0A6U7CNS5_9EUKA